MAATNNTIMALWGKSSVPKAKEASSDVISVHSTRSRVAEDRSAPEKEATSRLAKPDMERNMPAKDRLALKEPVCHTSLQVQGEAACSSMSTPLYKLLHSDNDTCAELSP